MGAGVSSDSGASSRPNTVARTVFVAPPSGGTSAAASCSSPPRIRRPDGGWDDDEAMLSPMQLDRTVKGRWQLEEEVGRWSDLPSATADRIEAAFVAFADNTDDGGGAEGGAASKAFATCTYQNRIATVDLARLVLTFGAAPSAASASASSSSSPIGAGRRVRRIGEKGPYAAALTDPFAVDDVPAVPILSGDDSPAGSDTSASSAIGANGQPLEFNNGAFAVDLRSVIYAHSAPVFCSGFSIDGKHILSSAKDGTMKYWEVGSSFLQQTFTPLEGSVLCASLSGSAPLAASGADDYNVRLYSLDDPSPKAVLKGHEHKVYGVDFTRDGRTIVSSSMDRTMRTWDAATQRPTREVPCHTSSIFAQRVSPLSPWLVLTASDDHTLVSHDLRISTQSGGGCDSSSTVVRRFRGHTKTLWGCDIRFDEGQFITCGTDNCVMLWDPRHEAAPLLTIASHKNPVHSVEYLPDGSNFLSSSRDMTFKVTDASTGTAALSVKAHMGHVYRATYNAVTDQIMTCGADSRVRIWGLKQRL